MRLLAFGAAGLLIGSFLTVVVHRLPLGEGIARGRSKCPGCGTEIRARDNIPVISWVLLRGRCRTCGEAISAGYPLTELATAVLFMAAGAAFRPLPLAIGAALFLGVLLAISIIDGQHRIVPNRIVYPSLVLFGAAILVGDLLGQEVDIVRALIGLAAYSVPLFLIALAVPGGMGMGDVKLAALIGLVLGALSLSHVAVAAGVGIIGGGLAAIVLVLVLRYGRRHQMPFGPYLAAGAAVALLLGHVLADTYLRLTGLR